MVNFKKLLSKLKYSLVNCLVFIQLLAFSIPSLARITKEDLSPTVATTAAELEYIMDLSLRTMLNKKVYLYINETLNKAATSEGYKGEAKSLISQTKLVFMLANIPLDYEKLEKILIDINRTNTEELHDGNDKKMGIADLDEILQRVINDKEIFKRLVSKDSYEQPLVVFDVVEAKGKKTIKRLGYESMDVFVNHPRYEDPDNLESKIIPKDDHKTVMVNLVKEAKSGDSIYFNFYDLDLKELAEALADAKNRNVTIMGGIDAEVYSHKPAVKELIDDLAVKGVHVEKVDSVGLNHQKIIVLKSKKGKSKTLFSSGNATQSCSGPEGDLLEVPLELRPEKAIANPNNMILVEGNIPAVIALSEIKKNIQYKLRGQAGFPIGGAYQLMGPWDAESKTRESMLMAFSPNGGLGNIGKDIYSRVFKAGTNKIEGAFFSFSSKNNLDDLFESVFKIIAARRDAGIPAKDIISFVGDSQFALREFSNLLTLSGFKQVEFDPKDPYKIITSAQNVDPEDPYAKPTSSSGDTKKVYIKDYSDPRIRKLRGLLTSAEWKNWQENIRVSPNWFNGGSVSHNGKEYPWQVKLHHKIIILADQNISNPGSSINFSEAGEANQEQIIIVYSRRITKAIRGAVKFLWDVVAGPDFSVAKEVERRNAKNSEELIKLAYKVEKYRNNITSSSQCLKTYSKASGISQTK